MYKIDLASQVRQTPLPKSQSLLPLFEAVMNSMQAINDKRAQEPGFRGSIRIHIERESSMFGDDGPTAGIENIAITDDGVGFDDPNWESFNTAFSPHRFAEGGKGLGRIIWLKAFRSVRVDSVYLDEGEASLRQFSFDLKYDGETFPTATDRQESGTTIVLEGFRSPYRETARLRVAEIADRLIDHFFLFFVRGGMPTIIVADHLEDADLNDVYEANYAASASLSEFRIGDETFRCRGFRMASNRLNANSIVYAAHGRAVRREKLGTYIPNLVGRLESDDGSFFYQAVVEGSYLDQRVNRERTSFDIDTSDDAEPEGLFIAEVSLKDIRQRVLETVRADLGDILADMNSEKMRRIDEFVSEEAPHYRILLKRRGELAERIAPDATRGQIDAVLHSALRDLELDMKAKGTRVLLEAEHIDDYDAYRERLSEFIEQYNELGAASLAHYVMHRRIIIDLLEKALSKSTDGDSYPLESVVHKIIFPMRATSDDVLYSQHNLWLVDERLSYHTHVSSDRALAKTPLAESNAKLRPDLVVFDQKGIFADEGKPLTQVVLVEFKRPGRNAYAGDDPLEQLFKLSEEIKAGRHLDEVGRPVRVANDKVPVFAYLVCDLPPALRTLIKGKDAQEMADGMGFYGYNRNYGVYYEVLEYEKLLADAKRRNRALFERLTLS